MLAWDRLCLINESLALQLYVLHLSRSVGEIYDTVLSVLNHWLGGNLIIPMIHFHIYLITELKLFSFLVLYELIF